MISRLESILDRYVSIPYDSGISIHDFAYFAEPAHCMW